MPLDLSGRDVMPAWLQQVQVQGVPSYRYLERGSAEEAVFCYRIRAHHCI